MKDIVKKIWSLIKEHKAIVILSIAFGIYCGALPLIAPHYVPEFRGLYHEVVDDGSYYQVRAHEIVDGHNKISNPYFYEHKDGFPMQFWLPDYILAKTSNTLGFSVQEGYMLLTILSLIALFLVCYAILFTLTRKKGISFFTVILLFISLFEDFDLNIFGKAFHTSLFGDFYLRLPSPGFNFIFWLITFLLFLLFIKTKDKRQQTSFAVLTALSFGFLFHSYPYYWTFYFVFFSVFIFALIISRSPFEYVKKTLAIFLGALLIAIPYLISFYKSLALPEYSETMQRIGMIHTHFPSGFVNIFFAAILVATFLALWYFKKIPFDTLHIFLFSAVVSTVIVVNQHIITGQNLEFTNHYYLQNDFVYTFVAAYLISIFAKYLPKRSKDFLAIIAIFIICALAYFSLLTIYKKTTHYTDSEIYNQKYMTVFNWLNQNAKKDDVVYADDVITAFTPAYTSQNVYWSPFGILFFLKNAEAVDRYIINHYFDTFDDKYILAHSRAIIGGGYLNEYGHMNTVNSFRRLVGLAQLPNEFFPQVVINSIKKRAKEIQSMTFENAISEFRADYIVYDKNKDLWDTKKFDSLKKVFENNDFIIYAIR